MHAFLHEGGFAFFYICFFLMLPFFVSTLVTANRDVTRGIY